MCPFQFCNHLDEEERAGCFVLIVFLVIITVNIMWLFLTMPWVGLQCVILAFPDHTHFLSHNQVNGLRTEDHHGKCLCPARIFVKPQCNQYSPEVTAFPKNTLDYMCKGYLKKYTFVRASMRENLTMLHADSKGEDLPPHSRSLISAFIINFLKSIMTLLARRKL